MGNKIYKRRLVGDVDGTGDLTITDDRYLFGRVYAVQLILGGAAAGVDITLTCVHEDLTLPVLTMLNFDADKMIYPRVLVQGDTDGVDLTGAAGGDRELPALDGKLTMVIAQGGVSKTGIGCIVYYFDGLV